MPCWVSCTVAPCQWSWPAILAWRCCRPLCECWATLSPSCKGDCCQVSPPKVATNTSARAWGCCWHHVAPAHCKPLCKAGLPNHHCDDGNITQATRPEGRVGCHGTEASPHAKACCKVAKACRFAHGSPNLLVYRVRLKVAPQGYRARVGQGKGWRSLGR
jgi:hypothetical protein